ncbi:cell wall-binding repeat-containing protein [Desulfosporosinus metallidurans]|uniref:N-acetylmuramoyl-L-alanine amidase n=1 Tax=Desulfosporosinus metallidurans TaxID=1888891 RepID=A0A1Q8QWR2_9FIRM|nr:cell wall-binding repeat-containing protein [Desulfosporosinus metallidurans]OLN31750.1 N-acetylmuramoyl-L-alanine amidase [Desulfosporosinus metallidurans]
MKKTKKALASLAIAGMTLSMLPFNAFAASTVPTRLAGGTAAQTAVAIAEQTGWTGTAILASSASYGMVDALTSGPLATFLKAPILLQEPGAVLNADTKAELTKLNVKKVYVTSGTSVISQAVLDQMTGMGITVESLGGADRFETSVNIAKKMVALGAPVSKVAVAYGWLNQDALSIAAIASASNSPILLTEKNAVPASVQAFLAANTSVTASDVIGGTGVISDAVKAALPNATRHAGNTAYDTNNQVIQDFNSSLTYGNVFVASGVTGIDALAGAPLAAASKSAIVLTDGTVPAAATFVHSKLAADSVVTALGGSAVVPETVRTGVVTGVVTPPTGALSVTSVSAVSAASFKVVFNQACVDTTKVTFTVKRSTTPVTVTATWNAAKTEATVTSASNLPEGSYTVAVKNDTTDLGTSTVAISQQKIAKINITSTKLAVVNVAATASTTASSIGYATYTVLDQYGNDITTSSLANNVTFQTGAGDVTKSKGVLKVTPTGTVSLIQLGNIVITGYDNTSGVSTSATLSVSTALGTLTDMQLTTLTNADNKVLTGGDTSSVFYLGYTATDISGNTTQDYNLVKGGMILDSNDGLSVSASNYVTARVIQDPNDSSKAAIEVKVIAGSDMNMDVPVTITAMTFTGKTSTFNVTLKKPSAADAFTLMAPSYDIAVNETKEIPFVAYDQNGVQLTKYSDLATGSNAVTLSGADFVENVDGTAKVMVTAPSSKGPRIITAMTKSGKFSSLTLNIQDVAKADSLTLDSSVLLSAMQHGATQKVDFGYRYGGFTVKDQYGRVYDMVGKADSAVGHYRVIATTAATTAIALSGQDDDYGKTQLAGAANAVAYGGKAIVINATGSAITGDTGTVVFSLVDTNTATNGGHAGTTADPYTVIDSKSVTFSVVKDTDIKSYTMDTVTNPIYANGPTSGTVNVRQDAYAANPTIYGTTSGGSKVVMGAGRVIGAYVDSTDFAIEGPISTTTPAAFDGVSVYAKPLANNVTSSSTNLTVTFYGADNKVHSLTTPIKSSTATPVDKTLVAAVGTFKAGVSVNGTGDVVTINTVTAGTDYLGIGASLARVNEAGTDANRTVVYFMAVDSYGTKADQLAQIVVVSDEITTAAGVDVRPGSFAVNQYGTVTSGVTATTGQNEVITLSGITTNGLVKTIKVIVEK